MEEGRIAQVGTPREIYNRPTSEFVAGFIGRTNLLHGDLAAAVGAGAQAEVGTSAGPLRCLFPVATAARRGVAVVVRPEHVTISKDVAGESPGNRLIGRVISEVYLGELMEYVVATEAGPEMLVRAAPGNHILVGDRVCLSFSPEHTVAVAAGN
ncbi:MAG: TOBE domain-containing protein [Gemmatimonas sp.]